MAATCTPTLQTRGRESHSQYRPVGEERWLIREAGEVVSSDSGDKLLSDRGRWCSNLDYLQSSENVNVCSNPGLTFKF